MTNGAPDARRLLAGLKDYHKSLEKHLNKLNSEYQQLDNRWRAFNAVSAGDYADQFRNGWLRTKSQFESYIKQSQKIKAMLDKKIKYLEDFNRQEGGMP